MRFQADSYLLKPYSARELLARIGVYLALHWERPQAAPAQDGHSLMLSIDPAELYQFTHGNNQERFSFTSQSFNHPIITMANGATVDLPKRKRRAPMLCLSDATVTQQRVERTPALEPNNGELDQFSYAAVHDLKSSLHAITQLANWLSEDTTDLLPEPSKTHLTKLRTRIKRLEHLLDDLLAYAQTGRQHYILERVDTAALVRDVAELFDTPSGVTMIIAETLPRMAAERVPLETVFRNLIGNTLSHHPRPQAGHVAISAQETGAYIEFSLRHDWSGSDPTFHEPSLQLSQTRPPSNQMARSDLGLAVAKKLVESRGGALAVESAAGHSAILRFTWPKEAASHF